MTLNAIIGTIGIGAGVLCGVLTIWGVIGEALGWWKSATGCSLCDSGAKRLEHDGHWFHLGCPGQAIWCAREGDGR